MDLFHHEISGETASETGRSPLPEHWPEAEIQRADGIFRHVFSKESGEFDAPREPGIVERPAEQREDEARLAADEIFARAFRRLEEGEFLSTYGERIEQTPKEGERGAWTGERGESTYIPANEKLREILARCGVDGIEYRDGVPDFTPCAEATVEIDNMSTKRYGPGGNFEQCDQKCADQWNREGRDGRTDWTARDVAQWREQNGYTWHERNDRRTCDLVPTEVNDQFGHLGGVAECKRMGQDTEQGGRFDE